VASFSYWPYKYPPGPATIKGINGSLADVYEKKAHVGDRMYVTIEAQGPGTGVDRIAYMQVVGLEQGTVKADMWVWNSSSGN
jgi:hypothetical protein